MSGRVLGALCVGLSLQPALPCPQLGCDPDQSNRLVDFRPGCNATFQVAWEANPSNVSDGSQLLCTSVPSDKALVCTIERPPVHSLTAAGVFGIDSSNGHVAWQGDPFTSSSAHPLLDELDGDIVLASDGSVYAGYQFDGTALGPTISVTTDHNGTFALTITEDGVAMILERSGLVSGYLTNGVVHASIKLIGNVSSEQGFFVPISTPLIIERYPTAGRNRVVFVTAFQKGNSQTSTSKKPIAEDFKYPHSPHDNVCRVYAVDVARTIDDRFSVAWFEELNCTYSADQGLSRTTEVPLIHDNRTKRVVFPVVDPIASPKTVSLVGLDVSADATVSVAFRTALTPTSTAGVPRVTSLTLSPDPDTSAMPLTRSSRSLRRENTADVAPATLWVTVASPAQVPLLSPLKTQSQAQLQLLQLETSRGKLVGTAVTILPADGSELRSNSRLMAFADTTGAPGYLLALTRTATNASAGARDPNLASSAPCRAELVVVSQAQSTSPSINRLPLGDCAGSPDLHGGAGSREGVGGDNTQVVGVAPAGVVVAIGNRLARVDWA